MKAEYINPLLQAAQSVLSMLCGITAQFGKLYVKNSPFEARNVVIIIGVTGAIKGQVILSLEEDTALNIACRMMGGMELAQFDELAKSAIGELGNMIMGSTSTSLYNMGIAIDITPPTVLTGQRLEVSNKTTHVCIPMDLGEFGAMEIGVSFE